MGINILNSNFKKIAIIDYYKSLIWVEKYSEIGAIDIQIEANSETLALFKKGYYIHRDDTDAICYIDALELQTSEEEGDYLIIGAYDCRNLLNRRVITQTEWYDMTVENYIRKLINDNIIASTTADRNVGFLKLSDSKGYAETIKDQPQFEQLADKITALCQTYDYGWKSTFDKANNQIIIDIYKGNETSVIFSPEYDNLSETSYKSDDSESKNVGFVVGTTVTDTNETVYKTVFVGSDKGLARRELYVDGSNIDSALGDEVDYRDILIAQGKEKLAETVQNVDTFDGDVNWYGSYVYRKDFNLGDIITIKTQYGINARCRITEVTETWDEEGYTIEPKFEVEKVKPAESTDAYILAETARL